MKKHLVSLLVSGLIVLVAWSSNIFCQTQLQSTPEQLKALKAAALVGYIPDKFQEEFKIIKPMCTAVTIPSTAEVWMSWMTEPKGSWVGGLAGFNSNPLTNSGSTDWMGVTITATFQVISVQGVVLLYIDPMVGSTYSQNVAHGSEYVTAPGTYQVTTPSFAMKAGTTYKGVATICPATGGVANFASGAYVKVISIKWNL